MRLLLTGNDPRNEYLFREFRRDATVVGELPFDPVDSFTRYLTAALSFNVPKAEWWESFQVHPRMQRGRSRVLQRHVLASPPADALFMWGSWFHPMRDYPGRRLPFFTYLDQSLDLKPLPFERHRAPLWLRRGAAHRAQSETYRDAGAVFCMSDWTRDQTLGAHVMSPEHAITVGWGPCGVDFSAEPPNYERAEKIVLHVGNDYWRKGIDFLMDTAKIVAETVPDVRFVVVGKDVSALPVADTEHVRFVGLVNDKARLGEYFRQASVFFLPHRFERAGHVLAEAMSVGVPIVTSLQGGPAETVGPGRAGFGYEVGDVRGYAAGIMSLLKDDELRRRVGERGRELQRTYYNWPTVASRMLGVMADVIGERAARERAAAQ